MIPEILKTFEVGAVVLCGALMFALPFLPLPKSKEVVNRIILALFVLLVFSKVLTSFVWWSFFSEYGDVTHVFYPQAIKYLEGGMPSRDFYANYSPFFVALCAGLIRLWNHPLIIQIFLNVLDLVAFAGLAWMVCKRQSACLMALAFYVLNPVSWLYSGLFCQDESLALFFLLATVMLLVKNKPVFAGFCFALSVGMSKLPVLVYFPAFWVASPGNRNRFLGSTLFMLAMCFLPWIFSGSQIFENLEDAKGRTGPSLFHFFVPFWDAVRSRDFTVIESLATMASVLVASIYLYFWHRNRRDIKRITHILFVTQCIFLLFSPKVVPAYTIYMTPFILTFIAYSVPSFQKKALPLYAIVCTSITLCELIGERIPRPRIMRMWAIESGEPVLTSVVFISIISFCALLGLTFLVINKRIVSKNLEDS